MTATKTDPVLSFLADFVAVKESGGDYNIAIGERPFLHLRDFSTFSIADVYDFQRQLLARGKPSSAVGYYQFVQRTLSGTVQQLGIDLTERFTPEMQDRLGFQLFYNRGYKRWLTGTLSNQDFAHNLSCEWASLPDPYNGGKSHYDGVGPNHAGRTLQQVYAALIQAKQQKKPAGS